MNPWILPGAALVLTGGWIALQKKTAADLQREITVINERIRQVRSLADADAGARGAEEKARQEKQRKIDWKNIAGKLNEMRDGGPQDIRAMMRMQRLLMDLSAPELCAELDKIAALDVEENTRKQLQDMIMDSLVEKDPKLALERFGDEPEDEMGGMRWQLGNALRKLAEKDPAAATAWLDKQIAAGKFESKSLDGRSQSLVQFESSLAGVLLKSDPTAVTSRVKALDEVQREQFFQQGFLFQLGKESEAAYAKLARDTMPADKVGGILATTAGNLVRQAGYERVDGFIASSHATDAEKQRIVERVFNRKVTGGNAKIDTVELEKARAWAGGQSPGVVDKATGDALGQMLWRGNDSDKIFELAVKYNEAGTNDEVLVSFLKHGAMRGKASNQAKALIDKIKDPAVREEIRNLPQYKVKRTEP